MRPTTQHGTHSARIPLYDNAKFVLIVSVVIGHMLKVCNLKRRRYARALFVFIYAFHMPLFIFLSGLFVDRRRLTWESTCKHALHYTALGMLAKLIRAVVPWLMGEPFRFRLLTERGFPWFMFALAAYYLLAWLLRKQDFVKVGCAALVLALVAGYLKPIGTFLCLARIIVFFPFFWLGHALDPKDVAQLYQDRQIRHMCLAIVAVFALFCIVHTRVIWPYRKLFVGRYRYASVHVPGWRWLHRGLAYLISLVVGAGVLGLVPTSQKKPVTLWGSRTLQVYLLHFEIIDVLAHLRVTRRLFRWGSWGWLSLVVLGVALACLLSLPDLKRLKLLMRSKHMQKGVPR